MLECRRFYVIFDQNGGQNACFFKALCAHVAARKSHIDQMGLNARVAETGII